MSLGRPIKKHRHKRHEFKTWLRFFFFLASEVSKYIYVTKALSLDITGQTGPLRILDTVKLISYFKSRISFFVDNTLKIIER